MATFTISLKGSDKLEKALKRKIGKYRTEVERAVGKTADDISDDWRRSVPVDEGDYRDSIGVEHQGLTAEVANFGKEGFHGAFLEHGTSRMQARPSAGPAAERGRATFVRNVREALGE